MMIPVRCFSCGKVIADAFEEFKDRTAKGENPEQVLNSLGITRYCCRRMLISNTEMIDDLMKFNV
ncbi:MAG: DNA-directed RNA polymerase subunit N [Candidatus Diapherotrites archaeon]|nr:DNA-directed RNA polymerase subunit N [Candidatus Diapherotrites archaeon]